MNAASATESSPLLRFLRFLRHGVAVKDLRFLPSAARCARAAQSEVVRNRLPDSKRESVS